MSLGNFDVLGNHKFTKICYLLYDYCITKCTLLYTRLLQDATPWQAWVSLENNYICLRLLLIIELENVEKEVKAESDLLKHYLLAKWMWNMKVMSEKLHNDDMVPTCSLKTVSLSWTWNVEYI